MRYDAHPPTLAIKKQAAAAIYWRAQNCAGGYHQADGVAVAGMKADQVVVFVQEMRGIEDGGTSVILYEVSDEVAAPDANKIAPDIKVLE